MDSWMIQFSPGDFACERVWGAEPCGWSVDRGYILAKHPNWPDEWMCLSCMTASVRSHVNSKALSQ